MLLPRRRRRLSPAPARTQLQIEQAPETPRLQIEAPPAPDSSQPPPPPAEQAPLPPADPRDVDAQSFSSYPHRQPYYEDVLSENESETQPATTEYGDAYPDSVSIRHPHARRYAHEGSSPPRPPQPRSHSVRFRHEPEYIYYTPPSASAASDYDRGSIGGALYSPCPDAWHDRSPNGCPRHGCYLHRECILPSCRLRSWIRTSSQDWSDQDERAADRSHRDDDRRTRGSRSSGRRNSSDEEVSWSKVKVLTESLKQLETARLQALEAEIQRRQAAELERLRTVELEQKRERAAELQRLRDLEADQRTQYRREIARLQTADTAQRQRQVSELERLRAAMGPANIATAVRSIQQLAAPGNLSALAFQQMLTEAVETILESRGATSMQTPAGKSAKTLRKTQKGIPFPAPRSPAAACKPRNTTFPARAGHAQQARQARHGVPLGHWRVPKLLEHNSHDPAVGCFWLSSYLLTPIVQQVDRLPNILGFKPALEKLQVAHYEAPLEAILHQQAGLEQMAELVAETFQRMNTMVSRLLVSEEALVSAGLKYTALSNHFLVHEELTPQEVEELIAVTRRNPSAVMRISREICQPLVLHSHFLNYTETPDSFIVRGALSDDVVKDITDLLDKQVGTFYLNPHLGDGAIANHIRGIRATVQSDFIVVPKGLFHPDEMSEFELELESQDTVFDVWRVNSRDVTMPEIMESLKRIAVCPDLTESTSRTSSFGEDESSDDTSVGSLFHFARVRSTAAAAQPGIEQALEAESSLFQPTSMGAVFQPDHQPITEHRSQLHQVPVILVPPPPPFPRFPNQLEIVHATPGQSPQFGPVSAPELPEARAQVANQQTEAAHLSRKLLDKLETLCDMMQQSTFPTQAPQAERGRGNSQKTLSMRSARKVTEGKAGKRPEATVEDEVNYEEWIEQKQDAPSELGEFQPEEATAPEATAGPESKLSTESSRDGFGTWPPPAPLSTENLALKESEQPAGPSSIAGLSTSSNQDDTISGVAGPSRADGQRPLPRRTMSLRSDGTFSLRKRGTFSSDQDEDLKGGIPIAPGTQSGSIASHSHGVRVSGHDLNDNGVRIVDHDSQQQDLEDGISVIGPDEPGTRILIWPTAQSSPPPREEDSSPVSPSADSDSAEGDETEPQQTPSAKDHGFRTRRRSADPMVPPIAVPTPRPQSRAPSVPPVAPQSSRPENYQHEHHPRYGRAPSEIRPSSRARSRSPFRHHHYIAGRYGYTAVAPSRHSRAPSPSRSVYSHRTHSISRRSSHTLSRPEERYRSVITPGPPPPAHMRQITQYVPHAPPLVSHRSDIGDIWRARPFQPRERQVTPDTVFVSLLTRATGSTKEYPLAQLFRMEFLTTKPRDKEPFCDRDLFRQMNATYYGVRGWYRKFLFKGVKDIKLAEYDMASINLRGMPGYVSTTLHYEILTVPINYEEYAGYNNLVDNFKKPKKCEAKSTYWVQWIGALQGARPIRKRGADGSLSAELYEPPPHRLWGTGLLFVEGWILGRIVWTFSALTFASIITAVAWSVVRTVEQGVAVAGYLLTASSGLFGVVSLLSFLDSMASE